MGQDTSRVSALRPSTGQHYWWVSQTPFTKVLSSSGWFPSLALLMGENASVFLLWIVLPSACPRMSRLTPVSLLSREVILFKSKCTLLPLLLLTWALQFRFEITARSFAAAWTVAHQAPLSVRFPRREEWSGLPFRSPGDLPDPRIKPASSAWQVDALLLSHQGSNDLSAVSVLYPKTLGFSP